MIKILFNCIIHLNTESQVRSIHIYFSVIFIFIYKKHFDSGTPFNSSDIWTTGGGNVTFCPTCEDRRHWETAASRVLSALWERTVLSKYNRLKRKTICKLGGHESCGSWQENFSDLRAPAYHCTGPNKTTEKETVYRPHLPLTQMVTFPREDSSFS